MTNQQTRRVDLQEAVKANQRVTKLINHFKHIENSRTILYGLLPVSDLLDEDAEWVGFVVSDETVELLLSVSNVGVADSLPGGGGVLPREPVALDARLICSCFDP